MHIAWSSQGVWDAIGTGSAKSGVFKEAIYPISRNASNNISMHLIYYQVNFPPFPPVPSRSPGLPRNKNSEAGIQPPTKSHNMSTPKTHPSIHLPIQL